MPKTHSEATLPQRRARIASAVALGDSEAATEARRDYYAAKLADYVQRTVAAAPPLTDEQLDRIAVLLRGGESR